MPSLWTWLMGAPFSFLSNIIVSARSSSAVASPAPPEAQPFRFLDLPVEIRFMIYSQLAVRFVDVRVSGLDLPGCVIDASSVGRCFYPPMLRVSQEFRNEYSDYALPQTVLSACWFPAGSNELDIRERQPRPGCPILPKKVIAQLLCLSVRIPQRTRLQIAALISQLPMLEDASFSNTLLLDGFKRRRFNDPTELQRHGIWRQEVLDFLKSIDDDRPPWKNGFVGFWVDCRLYLPRWTVAERIAGAQPARADPNIPRASFQILDEDEVTVRLDDLIVKF